MRFVSSALLIAALSLVTAPNAEAQPQPRYGGGIQTLVSTVDYNIGPGFRFRVSAPINQDLSLGFGSAITGFIFAGRDDASYALDPQASLIVTLPGESEQSFYALAGAGVYLPFGNTSATSGPTFHIGIGKVWLLNESSFFFEVDPALFIREEETDILLPFRIGVIF